MLPFTLPASINLRLLLYICKIIFTTLRLNGLIIFQNIYIFLIHIYNAGVVSEYSYGISVLVVVVLFFFCYY